VRSVLILGSAGGWLFVNKNINKKPATVIRRSSLAGFSNLMVTVRDTEHKDCHINQQL